MKNREVTFTLSIGYVGAEHEETFTLEELGIIKGEDYETEEELEKLLGEEWEEWTSNYIEGGFNLGE